MAIESANFHRVPELGVVFNDTDMELGMMFREILCMAWLEGLPDHLETINRGFHQAAVKALIESGIIAGEVEEDGTIVEADLESATAYILAMCVEGQF